MGKISHPSVNTGKCARHSNELAADPDPQYVCVRLMKRNEYDDQQNCTAARGCRIR